MKFQPRIILPLGVAIISLLSSAIPAQAVTYYWDTDGNGTAGFGTASGTWGTDAFWSQDAGGGGASAPTNATIVAADAINFGTATVGLASGTIFGPATAQDFASMTFGSASGAILLSGGTLSMAATRTITVNNASSSISTLLQGAGGITKNGTGTLVLSGANTFAGSVTVDAGTVSVNSIGSNATPQPLGQGSLIQIGSGTLDATLEFTGNTNSTTDKQIRVGRSNNSGQLGGAIILNKGNGSLTFTNSTFNATLGGLTTSTVRTLTLGGTYSGGSNEIVGIIQNSTNAAGTTTANLNLTVSGSNWKLSGTNSYTGATSVTGGTLLINGSTHASSAVSVSSGATLGGTGRAGGSVRWRQAGLYPPVKVLRASRLVHSRWRRIQP